MQNARFLKPNDDLTPRFITAVNEDSFEEFIENTEKLRKENKRVRISVYDLGLSLMQQDVVKKDDKMELKVLPWSTFKAHVEQDFGNNAWKICILADALKEHPVVLWFASNIVFKKSLDEMVGIFNQKRKDSNTDIVVFTPRENDEFSTAYGTHKHMFEYRKG